MQETGEGLIPGSGRSLERTWQPIPVFLPGEFHGQRSLEDHSPQGDKESGTTEWLNSSEACIGPFQKITAFAEDAAWLWQFMEKCECQNCQTTVLISNNTGFKIHLFFLNIKTKCKLEQDNL